MDVKLVQPIISFIWRLKNKNYNFSIISNNCWGGGIYQELKVPYNSPTIGLYFYPDDYLKFLSDLKYYCTDAKLSFTNFSRHKNTSVEYPVGLLDNEVEIHFLHYHSTEEAAEKWNRRKERINWDNLFVKMDDRDGCTIDHCIKFDKLPFNKKVMFTVSKLPLSSCVWLSKCRGGKLMNYTETSIYGARISI